jgi:hypothetical protein
LIAVPTLVVEDGAFMFFTAPTPLGAPLTIERTAGVTVLRAICAGVVAFELVNRLALVLVTAGVAGFGAGAPFLVELVEGVELFFTGELVDPVFLTLVELVVGVDDVALVNRLALVLVTAGAAGFGAAAFGAAEPFLVELVEVAELFFAEEPIELVNRLALKRVIAISASPLWFSPSCSSHHRDQLCRLWRKP